jgi:hypothetical protein
MMRQVSTMPGRGRDVDFDFWRFLVANRRVGIEIALLDAAVLDDDIAEQRRRQPTDHSQEAKSGFTAISRSMAWTLRCAKVTLGM